MFKNKNYTYVLSSQTSPSTHPLLLTSFC